MTAIPKHFLLGKLYLFEFLVDVLTHSNNEKRFYFIRKYTYVTMQTIESQCHDRYILQNLLGCLMKITIIITSIIFVITQSSAQFDFLPSGMNVAPLRTNTQEPRVGVFKFLDASEMKVDIGNSIDLFGYDI